MGYIRFRDGRYQANIRRKGYEPITKTFTSREAAKSWTKTTEIQMERGEFNPHSNITVDELINKHLRAHFNSVNRNLRPYEYFWITLSVPKKRCQRNSWSLAKKFRYHMGAFGSEEIKIPW